MQLSRDNLTVIIAHAMTTGLYNETILQLNPDDPEQLEQFVEIGRKLGIAATAVSEGLHGWLEEQDSGNTKRPD